MFFLEGDCRTSLATTKIIPVGFWDDKTTHREYENDGLIEIDHHKRKLPLQLAFNHVY
ncbi:MAG: hypothetical protein J7K66_02935 [Anaerolineaceae bacterium]|nr:hypothetical protein [Anaerolineaceae bacterium]